jgi:CRP-like cAMP-binding protein
VLRPVPRFSDLDDDELGEGSGFYVIEAGEAQVLIQGQPESTLQAGDFFGEVAVIDHGPRMATVTAATGLDTLALTPADFRALVEARGVIGWKLLQRLARMFREERRHRARHMQPVGGLGRFSGAAGKETSIQGIRQFFSLIVRSRSFRRDGGVRSLA